MSLLSNNTVTRAWNFLFVELADPRTNDWPLIRNPLPGLTILGLYLYFVLSWGPRFMENRKPLKLQGVLVIYNFLQVLLSLYILYEALDGVWLRHYSFKCEPVDWKVNPFTMRVCRGFYIYFLAKLTELLDTIFFVVRKKSSQISFLHLYHHTGMPMLTWAATKYYPGGHGSFVGLINSFVHVFMYTYYMLSALGPKYQQWLWWKKYITVLQLLQFLIGFYHWIQLLWIPCEYPWWVSFLACPNAIIFIYLFSDFYIKAYKSDSKKKTIITNNNYDEPSKKQD